MALIASPRGANQKSVLQKAKPQEGAFARKYKEQKSRQEKNKFCPVAARSTQNKTCLWSPRGALCAHRLCGS
jgi:hypothetical protein